MIELLPVRLTIVYVTGGGAGKILIVTVFTQPTISVTVTVTTPGGKPVPTKEFPETLPGIGLQTTEAGTDAEPAVVKEITATELVQLTCVAVASTCALPLLVYTVTAFVAVQQDNDPP